MFNINELKRVHERHYSDELIIDRLQKQLIDIFSSRSETNVPRSCSKSLLN